MADRVQPLKFESPDSGGTQLDEFPTSLDASEDHLDARGIFFQDDSSDDEAVHASRDSSGNMTFKDVANPSPLSLTALVGGSGFDPNNLVFDNAGGLVYANNGLLVTET